jgi:hypothetical protein
MQQSMALCDHCGSLYVPTRSFARYCTQRCQQKASTARHSAKLPAIGEKLPYRQTEILECAACGDQFDYAIRRNTSSRRFCSSACWMWDKTHPGAKRPSGRICTPCGASIDHRRQSALTCGSRQCMWWNLHHPGEALPKNRTCKACRQPIDHLGITAIFCSKACTTWVHKLYPNGEKIRPLTRACAMCGVDITDRGSRAIYCSEACFGRSPKVLAKARASAKRRRARLAGGLVIEFSDEQLAQRMSMFGHRCYVCGNAGPTVDHVKPLAAGGAHCLANMRPMCKSCNGVKRDAWPIPPSLLSSTGTGPERLALLRQARRWKPIP